MKHPIELILANTAATLEIEARVFDAVGRLERFCDHITGCQVFIRGPAASQGGYAISVKVRTSEHEVLVASEPCNDVSCNDLRDVLHDAFSRTEHRLSEIAPSHCICSGAHASQPLKLVTVMARHETDTLPDPVRFC